MRRVWPLFSTYTLNRRRRWFSNRRTHYKKGNNNKRQGPARSFLIIEENKWFHFNSD